MTLPAMIRPAAFRRWRVALALVAGLAIAGCASYGGSPYGSYPGNDGYYPGGYGNQYGNQRVVGTVIDMDPRGGRLLLDAGDPRSYNQQRLEVYFDNNTRLYYQGRVYPVTGLERGDVVSVDVVDSRGRLWATRIEVVRNVRDSGGYRY
jgi:hypothetical protein